MIMLIIQLIPQNHHTQLANKVTMKNSGDRIITSIIRAANLFQKPAYPSGGRGLCGGGWVAGGGGGGGPI